MLNYVCKRLLGLIPTLLIVAVLVFLAWAVGAAPLVTGLMLLIVIALPRLHRDRADEVAVS